MIPIRLATAALIALLPAVALRAQQPQASEGFIAAPDGARLFYQKLGARGPVVIVPGRLFLESFVRQLADSFTVIAYDMRNRGRSGAVADPALITIQKDVEDLELIRAHFGAQRVSLIGYSYLGFMVVLYAREHPANVDRIVQIGPVPRRYTTQFPAAVSAPTDSTGADSAAVRRLADMTTRGAATTNPREHCEAAWAVARYGLVGNPRNVAKAGPSRCAMSNEWALNLRRHLDAHFTSVQKLDVSWEEIVPAVRGPVLVVHGTRDRNAPYGGGREWAMQLPDARLLTVRDGAHQVFLEYQEIVLPAVRSFLGGRWPTGAEKVTSLLPAASR